MNVQEAQRAARFERYGEAKRRVLASTESLKSLAPDRNALQAMIHDVYLLMELIEDAAFAERYGPPEFETEPMSIPSWLIIGATRYALGRRTYIVQETVDWLTLHWPKLPKHARDIIKQDLETEFKADDRAPGDRLVVPVPGHGHGPQAVGTGTSVVDVGCDRKTHGMKTTCHATSYCPRCLTVLDTSTNFDQDAVPKPKDFSVCAYCAEVLRYNPDLELRVATDDDLAEAGVRLRHEIRKMQAAAKRRRLARPRRPGRVP